MTTCPPVPQVLGNKAVAFKPGFPLCSLCQRYHFYSVYSVPQVSVAKFYEVVACALGMAGKYRSFVNLGKKAFEQKTIKYGKRTHFKI